MKSLEIRQKIKEYGEWKSHNIRIVSDEGEEIWTKPDGINGNESLLKKSKQLVSDVFGDISNLTVMDLGAMEGLHGFGLSEMGAKFVTMIEGRKDNVEKMNFVKSASTNYGSMNIIKDDVLNLGKYAKHDVILCYGLIYLFNELEVFNFIKSMYNNCLKGVIIDSVFEEGEKDINLASIVYENIKYYGNWRSNDINAYNSSLNYTHSWHFTSESLRLCLDKIGFTTVFDKPHFPNDGQNKRMFLCIKGKKVC